MNIQTVTSTIQLILAPVVMLTACSLVLNGQFNQYISINNRLREMTRERLGLIRLTSRDVFDSERLEEIDHQIPQLLSRHLLVRNALVLLYSAIVAFILDMFVIALAVVTLTVWLTTLVLLVFLIGILLFLGAGIMATIEVSRSHQAVHYEVERVAKLSRMGK